MTERLHFHFSLSCIGEGTGNPLQCSCLENPRDGEPGGLPSMGSHRVRHDWSHLAAAAAAAAAAECIQFGCWSWFLGEIEFRITRQNYFSIQSPLLTCCNSQLCKIWIMECIFNLSYFCMIKIFNIFYVIWWKWYYYKYCKSNLTLKEEFDTGKLPMALNTEGKLFDWMITYMSRRISKGGNQEEMQITYIYFLQYHDSFN